MFYNYLKTALRRLRRDKAYTLINIVGLAVGLASFLIIALYIRYESSYDAFHSKADRINRVVISERHTVTPTILAPMLKREFAEVQDATRLYPLGRAWPIVVRRDMRMFEERNFFYADSTVFDVFSFDFVAGSPDRALTRPNTIVLSQTMAHKYFGDENPVGQTVNIGAAEDFEVTGVFRDWPQNSHLAIDFLASFVSTHWADKEIWDSANFFTYILLEDARQRSTLQAKLDNRVAREKAENPNRIGKNMRIRLEPLRDIHLIREGALETVVTFTAIAVLILLIACINYMNLATAGATKRAQEVGVRKTIGARRRQLIGQFLGESAILTYAAFFLALILVELALPYFDSVSGRPLTLNLLDSPGLLIFLIALTGVASLIAGSYPALFLSSMNPTSVLKRGQGSGRRAGFQRKSLIVFQFAASIFLIIGAAVVSRQLDYTRSVDLGFDDEQVLILPIRDQVLQKTYPSLKQALLSHPDVVSASGMNSYPGYQRGGYSVSAEGLELPPGEFFMITGVQADADVVETLGLELIAGPGFPRSEAYSTEQGYVYLINEATVRGLHWTPQEAIGKRFGVNMRPGRVVGVVKDFHHASLHEGIEPLTLFMDARDYNYLLLRLDSDDMPQTLSGVHAIWTEWAPHRPFEYRFLDSEFDKLYRADEQLAQIVTTFAALAMFVACLGLYGLAAHAAARRTKEIGIRKVLGATVAGIVTLLSRDFVKLVLLAFVIATPIAYWAMNSWLTNFAYHIDIGWWMFVLAGVVALVIAILTVSTQAVRAALSNPVESLRYE